MDTQNGARPANANPKSSDGADLPQSANLGKTAREVREMVAEAKQQDGWRTFFSKLHRELDRQRAELVRQEGERKKRELEVLTEARLKALREQCLHALIHRGGELRQETAEAIVDRYTELEQTLWTKVAVLQEFIEQQRDNFSSEEMKERLGERRNRLIDKRLDALDRLVERLSQSFGEFVEAAFEVQSQPMAERVEELT